MALKSPRRGVQSIRRHYSAALGSFPSRSFYVDATLGNDANSGTYPDEAWQTIGKVNGETFLPGDRILFKRGETWREELSVPSSGIAGAHIVFSAYGSGDNPLIMGSDAATGWADMGGNIWRTSWSPNSIYVAFEDSGGVIHWGDEVADAVSHVNDYDWYHDWVGDWLYVYATADPDSYYNAVEGGVRNKGIFVDAVDYITVEGIDVKFVMMSSIDADFRQDGGISFRNAAYGTAGNCHTSFCNAGIYLHAASHHGRVVGNTVTECWFDGANIRGYGIFFEDHTTTVHGNTVNMLSMHDAAEQLGVGITIGVLDNAAGHPNFFPSDCIVSENEVYNHQNYGIFFRHDYNQGERTANVHIFDNSVHDGDSSAGVADRDGIAVGGSATTAGNEISNIFVYRNFIKNIYNCGIHYAGIEGVGAEVYSNILVNCGQDTTIAQGGIRVHRHGEKVWNNTIYNTINGDGIKISDPVAAAGHQAAAEIRNNIIHTTGVGDFGIDAVSAGNATGSDNCVHNCTADYNNFTNTNPVEADPVFVTDGSDFHLQSGSPCRNAGFDVSLTVDYDGVSIPQEANPAIGAYEYVP